MEAKILKGENVYIRSPKHNEITYINQLWSDIETTGEIGGPYYLSKEKAEKWYPKMVNPTDGRNFYCLIFTTENIPIGEVSFHRYDDKAKSAELNIKVESSYRGKGYSKEALYLFLKYYFLEFGGEEIFDNVFNNNPKGQKALLSFGFELISMDDDNSFFRMTKKDFITLYGSTRGNE